MKLHNTYLKRNHLTVILIVFICMSTFGQNLAIPTRQKRFGYQIDLLSYVKSLNPAASIYIGKRHSVHVGPSLVAPGLIFKEKWHFGANFDYQYLHRNISNIHYHFLNFSVQYLNKKNNPNSYGASPTLFQSQQLMVLPGFGVGNRLSASLHLKTSVNIVLWEYFYRSYICIDSNGNMYNPIFNSGHYFINIPSFDFHNLFFKVSLAYTFNP